MVCLEVEEPKPIRNLVCGVTSSKFKSSIFGKNLTTMKLYNVTYFVLGLLLTATGLFMDLYLQIMNWIIWILIATGSGLIGGAFHNPDKSKK